LPEDTVNSNNSPKVEKPTILASFIAYDICLRSFEGIWHSLFNAAPDGSLEDYFEELAINVYMRKREELSDIFYECLEKVFPDIDCHAIPTEKLNKIYTKLDDIDKNISMILDNKENNGEIKLTNGNNIIEYPKNATEKEKRILNHFCEKHLINRELSAKGLLPLSLKIKATDLVRELYQIEPNYKYYQALNFIKYNIEANVDDETLEHYCRKELKKVPINLKNGIKK